MNIEIADAQLKMYEYTLKIFNIGIFMIFENLKNC